MGYPDFEDVVPQDEGSDLKKKDCDNCVIPIITTDPEPVPTTPSVVYGHLSLGGALKHCLQTSE